MLEGAAAGKHSSRRVRKLAKPKIPHVGLTTCTHRCKRAPHPVSPLLHACGRHCSRVTCMQLGQVSQQALQGASQARMSLECTWVALSGDTHTSCWRRVLSKSRGTRKARNQSAAQERDSAQGRQPRRQNQSAQGRQPRRQNHRLSLSGALFRVVFLCLRSTCAVLRPAQRPAGISGTGLKKKNRESASPAQRPAGACSTHSKATWSLSCCTARPRPHRQATTSCNVH